MQLSLPDDPMNDPQTAGVVGCSGWSQSDGFLSSEKIITCTFLLGYYLEKAATYYSWQRYHHTEVLT
jgi:hypothetical protein